MQGDNCEIIPIVDFKPLSVGVDLGTEVCQDARGVCDAVYQAFKNIGFVYLTNTGITEKQVEDLFKEGSEFFGLDKELKSKFTRQSVAVPGWSDSPRTNSQKELKETFNFRPEIIQDWPNGYVPRFKKTIVDFYDDCAKLAHRVLYAISVGLKLEDALYLCNCHRIREDKSHTLFKLLCYRPPPNNQEFEPGRIRLEEHTDWGSITLLFQDQVGGLQVLCQDGQYRPANPIPGTVLVNIGDILQRWTANQLIATPHRVMGPTNQMDTLKTRYSAAFFAHPDDDIIIRCLDSSDKYPPISALDHFRESVTKRKIQAS